MRRVLHCNQSDSNVMKMKNVIFDIILCYEVIRKGRTEVFGNIPDPSYWISIYPTHNPIGTLSFAITQCRFPRRVDFTMHLYRHVHQNDVWRYVSI